MIVGVLRANTAIRARYLFIVGVRKIIAFPRGAIRSTGPRKYAAVHENGLFIYFFIRTGAILCDNFFFYLIK